MIIGISGKIGSGKSTVGKIIQYLTTISEEHQKEDLQDGTLLAEIEIAHEFSNWQIKSYAGKLKDCISIITGISRADLEKTEVKNKKLGEEWIRYGYADSFYRDKDGQPIMNNKQCSKEEYLEHYKINWQTAYKHEYTVRELLQLFGTEVGRQIHNDFWVNALFSDYKPLVTNWDCDGNETVVYEPAWIITDVRFPNELKAIKDRGGITIRLNRNFKWIKDGKELISDKEQKDFEENEVGIKSHPSETVLDNATFDYTIDNTGTIEELIVKVKEILIKEKII